MHVIIYSNGMHSMFEEFFGRATIHNDEYIWGLKHMAWLEATIIGKWSEWTTSWQKYQSDYFDFPTICVIMIPWARSL